MAYKGTYRPTNLDKYTGDPSKIVFRSLWERQVMKWCDNNPKVIGWSSEEIVIPYLCETDKKVHRYFMDFYIKFDSGQELLVEVKPKKQTEPPKKPKQRRTRRYISESLTYIKNQSKWKAARQYAAKKGMKFDIWDEDKLKLLGIKIVRETRK